MKNGFLTPVCTELVDKDKDIRKVVAPLVYLDKRGDKHVVPDGFLSDLASVPPTPLMRYFFRRADTEASAILHDWYCVTEDITREEADRLFYECLRSDGVGFIRAQMMWAAVRSYAVVTGK